MTLLDIKSPLAVAQKEDYEAAMRYLYDRYRIVHIASCVCGALTFEVEHGIGYSVERENAPEFFPGLPEEFWQRLDSFVGEYSYCNYCVNHWGLDLCACGSGESPEECTDGCPECGSPMQRLRRVVA